jgi:hypothetical protein
MNRLHLCCFSAFLFLFSAYAQSEKPSAIANAVTNAKRNHATEIDVPPHILFPTGVNHISDVVGQYSAAIGMPVSASVSLEDPNQLTTWYVFEISATPLHQPAVGSRPTVAVPSDVRRPAQNQVLIPVHGGEARVDGVVVKQRPTFRLELGREYLLILYFDSTGRTAQLAAVDGGGLFEIDRTSGFVRPVRPGSAMAAEVESRWSSRLDSFIQYLKDQESLSAR